LAQAVARDPWRALAAQEGPLALSVNTSKGDIAALVEAVSHGEGAIIPTLPGSLAAPLARSLGIPSWCGAPVSAACSTGLYGLLAAADLIEAELCERALVVAADRSLVPLVLAGFRNLGVLCGHRHPLDRTAGSGSGFAPAEGAAGVALHRGEGAWMLRGGVRLGDAGHETHFSDRRTLVATLEALWELLPEPELIVLHGTGTAAGDAYESSGLADGPWSGVPRLAFKPIVGHCLGASGLVELGVALHAPARRFWKLGFGFGGHLAAVALERQ
jgi:3-oxoacyl-(acyl-carrier-protein) synthase